MISSKILTEMVKRWQKTTALKRRRRIISSTRTNCTSTKTTTTSSCSMEIARKGHIFIYTRDDKRFMIPLSYLTSSIFIQLLKMSEEEFGLPRDGPIMVPCDGVCMEIIISLVKKDKENPLLFAFIPIKPFDMRDCSQSQLVLCGF
ncbi:putative small auxin-up RNA [Dioscorea sansibarensis]